MTRSPATPLPPPEERRRLREAGSLTRARLAERVGVRPDTVRAWESGRSTPRGRNREMYAKLLAALAQEAVAVRQKEHDMTVLTVRPDPASATPPPTAFAQAPPPPPAPRAEAAALTPAQAFDALYAYCAPALVRQTYLLSGRRDLARESVERAFQQAWDRWPEVARDPDPAGWVRAAAYEWALSPWHRFLRRHRRPEPPPPGTDDRALLEVLLRLPAPYRRTLLLYDGVGLGLPETAAETEASTRAAARRLTLARDTVAARLPALSDPEELHRRLAEVASTGRLSATEPPVVRGGGERRARFWTRAAIAFTVVLIGTTALTLRTAPTRYEPPVPAGETVRGVPPRVAPGPLSEKERELRTRLREELPGGPERLTPQAW